MPPVQPIELNDEISPTSKVFKCNGLEIYVVGAESARQACYTLIQNRVGAMPQNLTEFKGTIPANAKVYKFIHPNPPIS